MTRGIGIAMAIALSTMAVGACSRQPGSTTTGRANTETTKCPEGTTTAQKAPGSAGSGTTAAPGSTPRTSGTGSASNTC
jgi:hypothetical protein